ncbi:unnamed protein product [Clavelina lepadiformis]|uniref:Uncharacterized protein n=1 Tax=Clavelina lepadiformis TaxID=159417 RepID=A0ABP0GWR4_CLALP
MDFVARLNEPRIETIWFNYLAACLDHRVLIASSSKLQLSLQLVGWGLLIGFGTDLVSVLAVIDIIANTANMPFPKFQVFLQSIFKCLKIHFLPLKSWAAIRSFSD